MKLDGVAAAAVLVRLISSVEKIPILYTDSIRGRQVCRDDLWAISTDQLIDLRQFVKPLQNTGIEATALKELLADAGQGLRVLKTMLKIEHLPGGAAAAEQLIERIEAALGGP